MTKSAHNTILLYMKPGVLGFNGLRLRQAREAMGLSITSLAALIEVSKQAVSQYEKGADAPTVDVFRRMCATLKHEPSFFLQPVQSALQRRTCFYRSMAAATKTARTKAEVWAMWVREIMCYMDYYVELPTPNFPPAAKMPADPNHISIEQIEILASDLRAHWKLAAGPIPNLVGVAESNGIVIVRHTMDAETLDALSEWLIPEDIPLVILNADNNLGTRSRFDLAHEIGHLVIHRNVHPDMLRRPEMFQLMEKQAFRFGAALLLPEESFLEDMHSASLDALLSMKLKWRVSVSMMIERLRNLDIVSEDEHRRLRINYVARKWNRGEPFDADIHVEHPSLFTESIRLILAEGLQTPEQITQATGFSRSWIDQLLNLPSDVLSGQDPQLKVVEMKRRA